jgi:2-polyprenyl-3-methyl-5-hydroxy-6-metoxy-1,4-benzoquinol methylase
VSGQRCRACGLNNSEFLFQLGENRVARCPGCTHVFLDVVHTPESIRQMYEGYENPGNDFYFERIDEEVTGHFDSYLQVCREQCKTGSRAPRLLDIGCGNGALISRAQKQGFVCEGIETCAPLAEAVRKKLACAVHTSLLSECHFPLETFDVITMYDLIEHLQNPIDDLRRVQSWLKPSGVLFVLTPNDDAFIRRIARMAYRCSFHIVQAPMHTLYYPHHLSYFTSRSLRSLFEGVGLNLTRIETRNQEMSRLNLSGAERIAVSLMFAASKPFPGSRGKLLAWARRRGV